MAIILSGICCNQTVAQHKNFRWLAGTWKLDGKSTYEIWSIDPNGDLTGYSFHLKASDTIVTETISLEVSEGTYHYIADVAGDQPPVDFIMTSIEDNGFVAENRHHDFPKLIRYEYRKTEEGERLNASIEGNGKTIDYQFYKIK